MKNGDSAEIAVVGNEGIVGISLFMGGDTTPSRAVVQSGGFGFRLKAKYLKGAFDLAGPVMNVLLVVAQPGPAAGLEKRSCECYDVVKAEYKRLLPQEMAA